ncbi:MAG TPA: hypothetical protein VNA29_01990 [Sphingomicrobium sp.]|nr:hypothetical protein [Sphingomicrobium sp.]
MTLLVRHPDTPPGAVQAIDAELARVPGGAVAAFSVVGDLAHLIVPARARAERSPDLWRTTCFELFVGSEGSAYREFNFSPSGAWAAYSFDDYREGMCDAPAAIDIEVFPTGRSLHLVAKIEAEFPNPARVGLTAVIAQDDGAIRYWATSFAPGDPDFHAPAVRSLLFDGVGTE